MNIERCSKRLLCCLLPFARWRHRVMRNRRDLIRVIDVAGVERRPFFAELRKVYVTAAKGRTGNLVRIHLPFEGGRMNVDFHGCDGLVEIGPSVRGSCDVSLWDDGCRVSVGAHTSLAHCQMTVTGSGIEVGPNCMFADHVLFYAGDAHTLIDRASGAVKGARPLPITIGRHCWLGRECVFTKGAGVPDDTVVGIRAVVTKRFSDPYTALAGCPARVVTRDITWDAATPGAYDGAKHG